MQRVHIVALSPRSGTTLLMELMVHCFEFDGYADHEMQLYYQPEQKVERFCSKYPRDLKIAPAMLEKHPGLYVICLLRDPRDIVVSRHRKRPDHYWAHLGFVTDQIEDLKAAEQHPRFVALRYEDLVTDPDGVQATLMERIPFLKKTSAFSEFHKVAAPTERSVQALGGVRKLSTGSIGRWREELPRLKAQIERHGDIRGLLRDMGYETDDGWAAALDGVSPDNGMSRFEDSWWVRLRLKRRLRRKWYLLRDRLGWPAKRPVIVNGGA